MSLFGKREDETAPETAAAAPIRDRAAASPAPSQPKSKEGNHDVANIGKSIAIKGDLSGDEDLAIEGKVEGKVDLPNNQLTVGANGVVKAEVTAKTVVVIGHVSGNVNGTERVEIQATGVVDGDVTSPRLVVAEGAVLNGAIHMNTSAAAGAKAPSAARSDAPQKPAQPAPAH